MRCLLLLILPLSLVLTAEGHLTGPLAAVVERARLAHEAALKDHGQLVQAARLLREAVAAAEASGDCDLTCDLQAQLFWCRKMMTAAQLEDLNRPVVAAATDKPALAKPAPRPARPVAKAAPSPVAAPAVAATDGPQPLPARSEVDRVAQSLRSLNQDLPADLLARAVKATGAERYALANEALRRACDQEDCLTVLTAIDRIDRWFVGAKPTSQAQALLIGSTERPVSQALAVLLADPQDREACRTIGLRLFGRHRAWAEALPLLARSSDGTWSRAAQTDLASSSDQAQVTAAAIWMATASVRNVEPVVRFAALRRAEDLLLRLGTRLATLRRGPETLAALRDQLPPLGLDPERIDLETWDALPGQVVTLPARGVLNAVPVLSGDTLRPIPCPEDRQALAMRLGGGDAQDLAPITGPASLVLVPTTGPAAQVRCKLVPWDPMAATAGASALVSRR